MLQEIRKAELARLLLPRDQKQPGKLGSTRRVDRLHALRQNDHDLAH
jgi:hypothetical protein